MLRLTDCVQHSRRCFSIRRDYPEAFLVDFVQIHSSRRVAARKIENVKSQPAQKAFSLHVESMRMNENALPLHNSQP